MENNFMDDEDSEEINEEYLLLGEPFIGISSDESNAAATFDISSTSSASNISRQASEQLTYNFDPEQIKHLNEFNLENHSKELLSKAGTGDFLTMLHKHWKTYAPICFNVSENPMKNLIETDAVKILFKPLEIFICNDLNSEKILNNLNELNDPPQVCGKVFKAGEPSYFCRDCGSDPTCVLCSNCFRQSEHRKHKYKMMTSGGGGYCDCGDPEAWKQHPNCELHMPKQVEASTSKLNDENSIERFINKLPIDLNQRATQLFSYLLEYVFEMLSIEKVDELPSHLKPDNQSDDYVTMLYNDEVHSYEQVVNTLRKVLIIDDKKALEYAAIVDKEGRSAIKRGSKVDCQNIKEKVEKTMGGPINNPLETKVLHHSLVSHQYFAEKILVWLQKICEYSIGLKHILCKIGLFTKINDHSIVEKLMLADTLFWKSARAIMHQFFITTFFMDANWKKEFAVLYSKNYKLIWRNYVKNPDDTVSLTDLAVQMFTVISLSKYLITNHNLLQIIMDTLIEHTKTSKGKLSFPRNRPKSNPEFKRAQFILYDLKYCLTSIPEEWNDDLRKNFINGFKSFVDFMKFMHGMDSLTRQVQQHIEYEPEWETSFNLLIKLQKSINAIIEWCSSDKLVYLECYKYLLNAIHQAESNDTQYKYNYDKRKVNDQQYEIIDFAVIKHEVSIHATLTRLFAAIYAQMENFGLNYNSIQDLFQSSNVNPLSSLKYDLPKQNVIGLLEPSIRALVLVSQTNAGLWKRNGFSLLSQVYFYSNIKCRHEMYDRDIQCLQMGASVLDPNEFLVNLMTHYSLFEYFTDDKFDLSKPEGASDELKQEFLIPISEDFLELLIVILSEIYDPMISKIEPIKYLEREVIHQLCISPMPHSDLVKNIYPDNEKYTSDLELVLNTVAMFKNSAPTSNAKGVYELKEEYLPSYSPYFYHYTKSEKTKSEEQQMSLKKSERDKYFYPSKLPELTDLYSNMPHLLDSDLFIRILFCTLRRISAKSKSCSEGQLARVLHLIGLALHEEQKDFDKNSKFESKVYNFKFLEKSIINNKKASGLFSIKSFKTEETLIKYLNEVIQVTTTDQYKFLAMSLVETAQRLTQLKFKIDSGQKSNETARASSYTETIFSTDESKQSITTVDMEVNKTTDEEMQKRKNTIAEKRRAKVLAQLNQMQKKFIQNNKEFYDEAKSTAMTPSTSISESVLTSEFDNNKMDLASVSNEVVCIGPNKTLSSQFELNKKRYHCILCQEDQEISIDSSPMVLCCYVQSSKVLSKNRLKSIENFENYDPLFMSNTLYHGIMTVSCGHVMHATCWQKYVDTVKLAENRRHNRSNIGFSVKRGEYLCPLCETIGNSVLPLFPDFKELNKNLAKSIQVRSDSKFSSESQTEEKTCSLLSYEDWLDGLEKTLENSVHIELKDEKDVFIINSCPLSTITKLMADTVASNFKSLFEFDTFVNLDTGNSSPTSSLSLGASKITTATTSGNSNNEIKIHNETLKVMENFTNSSFKFGYNHYPTDIDARLQISLWSNCAFTIQALEQLLRVESKHLFGQFTLKQADLLSNIVKQSALYGINEKRTESIRKSCVRLLAALIPSKTKLFEPINLLEIDMFHLLVYLTLSIPNLYDKPMLSSVINNSLNDFNVFKLVLQAFCVQIVLLKLKSKKLFFEDEKINEFGNVNDNCNVNMDIENKSEKPDQTSLFFKFILDLIVELNMCEFNLEEKMKLKNLKSDKLNKILRNALMPFLRCASLFYSNLNDLVPSMNITSSSDDSCENFSGLLMFLGVNNLDEILNIESDSFKSLCKYWMKNLPRFEGIHTDLIDYPLKPNEFIDLPNDFVDLISMSMTLHVCSSRSSSLMETTESATTILCLVCGEMLCSQTFCCIQEIGNKRVGSCTAHAYKCGNSFGVFLRVAECQILLLHLNMINSEDLQVRGCFVPAPYLDDYGETDQGLRRGNPLHLCKLRFKKLYKDWLSHAIPDEVSRSYQNQSSIIHMDWNQL